MPDNPALTSAQQDAGTDAPDSIRGLLEARPGTRVLRYVRGQEGTLRDYLYGKDKLVATAPDGTGPDEIPRYLLIVAGPAEIPWRFQYALTGCKAVGRLDLPELGMSRYVRALIDGWKDSIAEISRSVTWAVDHNPTDITHLMRYAVAEKVVQALQRDPDLKVTYVNGAQQAATAESLLNVLAREKPALVITSSHGMTGPLGNPDLMGAQLGLPVGGDYGLVHPDQVLANWDPDGSIWYAHACCSAGSDEPTLFDGITDSGSDINRVLLGVAALGARVAPLPRALLGAEKPLRAFIGHVEPTFSWSLEHPQTKAYLTSCLTTFLYNRLYQPVPVGQAMRPCYDPLATLYQNYDQARTNFNRGTGEKSDLLFYQLIARDLSSRVLLGDPTATLPPLP